MKKRYLIPILGLTTIAPAVTCLVSCNNIKGEPIEMKLTTEGEADDHFFFYSDQITLKQNSTYTIVTDLSQLTKHSTADALVLWAINPQLNGEGSLEDYMDVQEVIVNGKSLPKMTEEQLAEGGWALVNEFLGAYPKESETFRMEGKMYIIFKAKQNLNDPAILALSNGS